MLRPLVQERELELDRFSKVKEGLGCAGIVGIFQGTTVIGPPVDRKKGNKTCANEAASQRPSHGGKMEYGLPL